jgi:hypothetical protein
MSLGPGIPLPRITLPSPLQDHQHQLPKAYRVGSRLILGGLHHEYELENMAACSVVGYDVGEPGGIEHFDDQEVSFMPSLTVDAELYQQATEAAAAQGKSVDKFVDEALRQALSRVGVRRTVRNGLPVMVVRGDIPAIDPAKVRQCLEEEGF